MKGKDIFVLVLFFLPAVFSEDNEYCKLESCPKKSHTLCMYQNLELARKCGTPVPTEINDTMIKFIIDTHEFYRTPFIIRKENLISLPDRFEEDTPLLLMEWDQELAIIAQRWANQCESGPDKCRNVGRFNVTQRVYLHLPFFKIAEFAIHQSIMTWYEHEFEDRKEIQKSNMEVFSSSTLNAYIKIAWANANKIGCGLVHTKQKGKLHSYFICNYGYMDQRKEDKNE